MNDQTFADEDPRPLTFFFLLTKTILAVLQLWDVQPMDTTC